MGNSIGERNERACCFPAGALIKFFGFVKKGEGHFFF